MALVAPPDEDSTEASTDAGAGPATVDGAVGTALADDDDRAVDAPDGEMPTIVPADPEDVIAPAGPTVPATTEPTRPSTDGGPTIVPATDSRRSPRVTPETARHRRPATVPRRRRPRVRRVTRVVRSIDPWTVFKIALVVNLALYAVVLLSGVMLWNVANATGTVDNVERFLESFGWEQFDFRGGEIFHASWIIGLFGVLLATGLWVLAVTVFNLVADLVGGVRVTVLEEEVVVVDDDLRAG